MNQKLSKFWYYLWRQKRSEHQKSFLTVDVLFDVLIFNILIFQSSDHPKKTFDVLTLQCSDFWHSDPLPRLSVLVQHYYFFQSDPKNVIILAWQKFNKDHKVKCLIRFYYFLKTLSTKMLYYFFYSEFSIQIVGGRREFFYGGLKM
jgi:hypothetical protein